MEIVGIPSSPGRETLIEQSFAEETMFSFLLHEILHIVWVTPVVIGYTLEGSGEHSFDRRAVNSALKEYYCHLARHKLSYTVWPFEEGKGLIGVRHAVANLRMTNLIFLIIYKYIKYVFTNENACNSGCILRKNAKGYTELAAILLSATWEDAILHVTLHEL